MENTEKQPQSIEKGISIETCIEKADKYIEENGACLFVLDLKNSRSRTATLERLDNLLDDLNVMFDEYLPQNQLRTAIDTDRGFMRVLGDGVLAGITDARVIPETAEYIQEHYEDLSFYYNVAVDGYDKEGTRTIR